MSLLDNLRKNEPTSEDWSIASALKSLKGEIALVKAKQLADPDNLTDPDDRAVMAALNDAEGAIDKAIVAQSRDGRSDDLSKAALSAADRKALPDSAFVFPATREYPIPDESHARSALTLGAQHETGARLAKIRSSVKAKFPGIDVAKTETVTRDVAIEVPLWKDDSKHLVYGVVLSPGLKDSQGDIPDAESIEKAAHDFLVEFRQHDVQHDDVYKNDAGTPIAETVESFIAPSDMEVAGEKVLKGAWVMAVKVADDATWGKVQKGEITGFSIAGTGQRLPD
jgi:hypothetical protein